jgi:hypothetical protein
MDNRGPLKNSEEIIAVAALLPFPRWGKSKTTSIFIDDIALVCVPRDSELFEAAQRLLKN